MTDTGGETSTSLVDRPVPTDTASLTFGGDKSGLSAGAVALPQGPGKVQGLGESFSAAASMHDTTRQEI